jgi:hypothetical protein
MRAGVVGKRQVFVNKKWHLFLSGNEHLNKDTKSKAARWTNAIKQPAANWTAFIHLLDTMVAVVRSPYVCLALIVTKRLCAWVTAARQRQLENQCR